MHLLYLDESGNESDPKDRFFVLGGLSLFERQTYFLTEAIEEVQQRHFPNTQPITFHASEIRSGRGFWRKVPPGTREQVLLDLCAAVAASPGRGRVLYAAAVEKSKSLWGEDAVEKATEEVCRRFDIFLQRRFKEDQDPQRGLIVFSEGRFDARAKIWVKGFHERGTSWGAIYNLADIPYFASPKESRLLQVADLIAHAVWLLYEKRNTSLAAPLIRYFGLDEGTLHGLVHVKPTPATECNCPACASRSQPGSFGDWIAPPGGSRR
jgi:hypothetical protein